MTSCQSTADSDNEFKDDTPKVHNYYYDDDTQTTGIVIISIGFNTIYSALCFVTLT